MTAYTIAEFQAVRKALLACRTRIVPISADGRFAGLTITAKYALRRSRSRSRAVEGQLLSRDRRQVSPFMKRQHGIMRPNLNQFLGKKVRIGRPSAPTRLGILQVSDRIRGFFDVFEAGKDGRRKPLMLDADSVSSVEIMSDSEESGLIEACICGAYEDFRKCPTHQP